MVIVAVAMLTIGAQLGFGTAQASSPITPGSEYELEAFTAVRERTLAAPATAIIEGFTPCVGGTAAGYPCRGVDLLSRVSLAELDLTFANDIWGWTDSQTGDEYALVGGVEGTAVVRVTDPMAPVVVARLETPGESDDGSMWTDIKVYNDHAFVVSESETHALLVFDLAEVRGLTSSTYRRIDSTTVFSEFTSAHNIAINENSGFAYIVGAANGDVEVCDGGLYMVDISLIGTVNQEDLQSAGCWSANGYVHDTQCVIYQGPDVEHQGKEVCVNSVANYMFDNTAGLPVFANKVVVIDVTDKADPVQLADVDYGNGIGYSHQGWLTPDQSYFLHGDELDEYFGVVPASVTRVWDMTDLDAPRLVAEPTNGVTAIDHNMYTRGGYAYQSNYQSGLRVRSISNIASGVLPEVAFFDVYPEADAASFDGGSWSNYPYFETPGLLAVSSMDRGLFLLGHRMFCDGRRVSVDISRGMQGTSGSDVIIGTDGPDVIDAGYGNDIVCALGGDDVVHGGNGNDRIFGGGGADTINGDLGIDTIYGGGGNDSIDGGAAGDTIYGQPGGDTIRGGGGADAIFGGPGYDAIYGDDGDDNLQGAGGNDRIYGGPGDDAIYGKPGDDQMWGEAGDDEMYAASGDDEAYGGAGNDRLQGAGGKDTLDGGDDDDLMYGQNDDDVMRGGDGNDAMYAAAGNDRLFGGAGDDNLQGASGDDELRGEDGDDLLYGQAGTDTIDGGAGSDTCFGSGADQVLSC